MNFRRKIVYIVIGCTLILVVLFTVNSVVGFNSQNASAEARLDPLNKVGIKIKINYNVKTVPEPKKHEEAAKENIKNKLEKAIKDNTNLQVVKEEHRPEWMIYYLINQEHGGTINQKIFVPAEAVDLLDDLTNQKPGTADMSIILTHNDRFVMNHIKAISIYDPADLRPFIDDMIEVVLNVIQKKMENKDAPIIVTDKSTIVN